MRKLGFEKVETECIPEDTHALLCVPVIEELQAEDKEKLGEKENDLFDGYCQTNVLLARKLLDLNYCCWLSLSQVIGHLLSYFYYEQEVEPIELSAPCDNVSFSEVWLQFTVRPVCIFSSS